jgi:hypothetical protein
MRTVEEIVIMRNTESEWGIYNQLKICMSLLHLMIWVFTLYRLTLTTNADSNANSLTEGQSVLAPDLLQPLSVQQKTQKYVSLLLSHTSIPKPRFTFVSANPHGPKPHSLLRVKPFWAVTNTSCFINGVHIVSLKNRASYMSNGRGQWLVVKGEKV